MGATDLRTSLETWELMRASASVVAAASAAHDESASISAARSPPSDPRAEYRASSAESRAPSAHYRAPSAEYRAPTRRRVVSVRLACFLLMFMLC